MGEKKLFKAIAKENSKKLESNSRENYLLFSFAIRV